LEVEATADHSEPSPLAHLLASHRREQLLSLLEQLSQPVAEALAMHFVLGYTVEEIGAAAQVSVNTVWSRLRLGRQALRRALAQDARVAEVLMKESP